MLLLDNSALSIITDEDENISTMEKFWIKYLHVTKNNSSIDESVEQTVDEVSFKQKLHEIRNYF